ncbi:UDP-N-acetylmuramoyl-tripeptide--D-alanyl-D-alanine ligase [Flavimarina sp. Hel_I_48]|uniref:UDP-N-acetylmuramoyl-tripeptide--D-alanyl-D- alanine ligase n=1 Tax=Flavimarina sp. Hel_I_48 TaxID=1392488 RepID=UPI0004DFB1CB|nr:UDP-N-acetylmuramoyl-tripeptide--D-alanyl-D-alanine ligase [Flavimarina sp. Hel_I_48]
MTINELHDIFLKSSGICIDTRKISQNSLFFALSGENFNGNTFADKALKSGACNVVIDDDDYEQEHTLLVKDSLKALQDLAHFHRKFLGLPIIALTGSNGKTTTKELINAVLSKKYKITATQGNLNNHIGVPLTLLSMNEKTEIGIVEMGANHLKEIKNLSQIAAPDYGYITNFGKAHLEGFGSEAGVVKGKSELYDYIKANGGTLFINADDEKQRARTATSDFYSFGTNANNNLVVTYPPALPFAEIIYQKEPFTSQLTGFYNASNMAAALSMGVFFEVEPEKIKEALAGYKPANNRSQLMQVEQLTLLLDAYNANPTSMEAALTNFKGLGAKHKIAILGDMFELGDTAESEHMQIATLALAQAYDSVVLIGKNFAKTHINSEKLFYFDDVTAFEQNVPEQVKSLLKKETLVLIKGSRGMALERLVPTLKKLSS